ncbi:molybdenum cofactor guanylyltransferase [Roseibium sp.]|uniref:molybdenum cofactor guanylyltransferase n=1 Tax=Roseibium sp. TaxID=1936156 RepID=UPI0035113201
MTIAAAIFCGGTSRRFGGPKGLAKLGGQSLIERAIGRLRPQVNALALCAGEDAELYRSIGATLVPDPLAGKEGPASALLGALNWAAPEHKWLATAPCDMPFLPEDLVARLSAEATPDKPCFAASRSGNHYTVALWPTNLLPAVRSLITDRRERALHRLLTALSARTCNLDDLNLRTFLNVNSKEDLRAAEELLTGEDR